MARVWLKQSRAVSSRLERTRSGRAQYVVISAPLPGLAVGSRFIVLGTEIGARGFRFTGESTGRPQMPAETQGIRAPGSREYPEEVRQRALELVDADCSWAQAAAEVGVPKSTVGDWIRKRRVAGNGDVAVA